MEDRLQGRREAVARIRACQEEIIAFWEADVRAAHPEADALRRTPLRNALPRYLDALADCLESEGGDTVKLQDIAKTHAEQRTTLPAYSLKTVVDEYRRLRRAIFVVVEGNGRPLSWDARDFIVTAIEEGMAEAAYMFSDVHLLRERESARARENLLAVVSHDLKNPLQSAGMAADVLSRMSLQDDKAKELVRRVKAGIERADGLVRDLLDLAQMESEDFVLRQGRISALRILEGAIERQTAQVAARGVTLHTEVARDDLTVMADAEQATRILSNLIDNAIKFSEPGGPVCVALRAGDEGAVFSVEDEGRGMSPEEVSHIFDRFWQNKRRPQEGAGLGLAVVKGLVAAHGGDVRAESEKGKGSRFTFTLPYDRGEQ